jgi:hypothetical protein
VIHEMTSRTQDKRLLEEIRGSRATVEALVQAWLDDLLDRRVDELFEASDLARIAAASIREMAADPRNEKFLARQIAAWLDEAKNLGPNAQLPGRAVSAFRDIVNQPYVLEEDLVIALLDHEAAHVLLREVLRHALFRFSAQVINLFPGGEMAFWLVDKARGIAASATGGVAAEIEDKINESVDEALAPAFKLTAGRIADREFAGSMGDWRGHVLDVLLGWPTPKLVGSLEQVDPEELAGQFAAFLQGVAGWEKLEEVLRTTLVSTLDRAEDQSIRSMLSGSSLEQNWRPALEKQIADAVWPFVQSESFAAWLASITGGRGPTGA